KKIIEALKGKNNAELIELMKLAVGGRQNRRDRSPRTFEHGYDVTVEAVGNFGIFRDLHRHRMMTLERQALNPHLGFTVPDDIVAIGGKDTALRIHADICVLYDDIERTLGTHRAEYAALFGHHIRWMMGMNLREAQHLLELRTVPQGHPDYRRVAQKIHKEILKRASWIGETDLLKFVDHNNYQWSRADAEARQSRKIIEMGS
ncbi:MAG: FAD-dependent thymidylate synthase, partial [Patescibacteria group bacterium]